MVRDSVASAPYQGGQRVLVQNERSELHGKTLIVVSPYAGLMRETRAVQCFDAETGYIWPFRAEHLQRV